MYFDPTEPLISEEKSPNELSYRVPHPGKIESDINQGQKGPRWNMAHVSFGKPANGILIALRTQVPLLLAEVFERIGLDKEPS